MKRLLLGIIWILLVAEGLNAQEADTARNSTFLPLPVVFRLPETDWAFGAATLYGFFLDDDPETLPSQIQLGGAYTLNDQVLLYLPFQLFGPGDRWRCRGEVGYYRYSYFFFGVGRSLHNKAGELYHVDFPRLRLDALKPVGNDRFVGLRYWLENYKVDQDRFEPGGFFEQGVIAGSAGGVTSGLGAVFLVDKREHNLRPRRGYYVEASYHHFGKALGSDYLFDRYRLDARAYWKLLDQLMAAYIWLDVNQGNVPFNQMSLLGGSRRLRGFYEGRFRDRNAGVFQLEYRPVIYRRWEGSLFVNTGIVSDQVSRFHTGDFKFSCGAGLRFVLNESGRLNLRLDAAVGEGQLQTYFTFGEAF